METMTVHTFFCMDGHTCGNPVRLVAGGGPLLEGTSMSARHGEGNIEHGRWLRRSCVRLLEQCRRSAIVSLLVLIVALPEKRVRPG